MRDEYYGRLLVQRYQLLEIAGKGSMGQVYQAKDTLLGGVIVAVKFLSRSKINQRVRDRFMREATISALLGEKSIHIVKVRDYGVDDEEMPFYVMEFLKGESLKEAMQNKPMPLPKFFSFMRQICLGLQCAHDGIEIDGNVTQVVHRDIKPSNIIIIKDATLGELVKVLDFGIALLKSDDSPTGFMGTPAYCSPEQMDGKTLDNRADIYSLGIMMFQMLTGELPLKPKASSFEGWFQSHHYQTPKSFSEVKARLDLPPALMDIVNQCMAKTAVQRPSSVTEVLNVLTQIEQVPDRSAAFSNSLVSNEVRPAPQTNTIEAICLQSVWPKDKPRAEIVFPQLIEHQNTELATMWIMLSRSEIEKYRNNKPHAQFLFVGAPHPMLLWLTTLYQTEQQHRMLPCYLDLKKPIGEKTLQVLTQTGSYRLILFALEGDERCVCTIEGKVPLRKIQLLKEWSLESQNSPATHGQIKESKRSLKEELESLKPKLVASLQRQISKKNLN
ncbi:serine/threonine-protein kinase [Chamaesiphon sp. OTE_20_metabat_361]|uniref:serine/threonine protein kinase n=1 Tax=Chamaesiphon sp. OTE_20_metabat_361 TaxID=2964689 RepID=UPI00286B0861|nr:serine/threonine-protein kinase [Chamaesiphon sp. OTE_20_metabat_361]